MIHLTATDGTNSSARGALAVDVVIPGKGGLCLVVVEDNGDYRLYKGPSSNPVAFGELETRGTLENLDN